jgi:hypothetical protein
MKNKIYHTVGTVPKYTTLSEQFQNIPHCRNSSKIYHTVGTVLKYTTLSEQFQNIPHCRNSSKIYHTVGTVPKSKGKNIERRKFDTRNTNSWPFNFLAWDSHFNKKWRSWTSFIAQISPLSEMIRSKRKNNNNTTKVNKDSKSPIFKNVANLFSYLITKVCIHHGCLRNGIVFLILF